MADPCARFLSTGNHTAPAREFIAQDGGFGPELFTKFPTGPVTVALDWSGGRLQAAVFEAGNPDAVAHIRFDQGGRLQAIAVRPAGQAEHVVHGDNVWPVEACGAVVARPSGTRPLTTISCGRCGGDYDSTERRYGGCPVCDR